MNVFINDITILKNKIDILCEKINYIVDKLDKIEKNNKNKKSKKFVYSDDSDDSEICYLEFKNCNLSP
jgi:hypothetical protein